jgi:protein-arginine deiminase
MQVGEPVAVPLPVDTTEPAAAPPRPNYHVHLDADRDGNVDDDWRNLHSWRWGRGRRGTIIFCNNDDDDGAGASDNEDARINGGNDNLELAPLVIRRDGPAPPGDWAGYLEVSRNDAGRFRLFDSRAAGGNEILGPTAGNRHRLPNLSFTELELGMEALRYAGRGFDDGSIEIYFSILEGGTEIFQQQVVVRVAPWMMPNHLEAAEKVFVTHGGPRYNNFRRDLRAAVTAAGCTLQVHNVTGPENDIWMQDCMEIGYSAVPGRGYPVVVRAKRDRPLQTFPPTIREVDFGYHAVVATSGDTTFDGTGNLEVTPPVTVGTREYPWGRIYYGPGMPGYAFDGRTRDFLRAQTVQRPFEVDTSWLLVGHVDEIISFVPAPGAKGWKLLLASPRRAYGILTGLEAAHGSELMLIGRHFNAAGGGLRSAQVSIHDFLNVGISGLGLSASDLRAWNDGVATRMDGVRSTFQREIGATAADIIEVPILYMPNEEQPTLSDAITAAMVNMLVINGHCIPPRPFGPVVGGVDRFEEDLRTNLVALGRTVTFIDDWETYHVLSGEVHCGTNTLRRVRSNPRWWEYSP